MGLDEVTQICPVPLPSWLSDSGGKGIQVIAVVHGEAQLAERWGDHGRQVVLDTSSVKVFLPGITDTTTLEAASKLCGQASWKIRGQDHATRHDVATPDMIRQLPAGFALVIRGGCAPVIARLPRAWKNPAYRRARRLGHAPAYDEALPDPVEDPDIPDHVPADWLPGDGTRSRGADHDRRPDPRDPGPARRPRRADHPARHPARHPGRHLADLAAGTSTGDGADPGRYQPGPAPPGGSSRPPTAHEPIARLRAWVEQVYRPGYGHLAATLGPCWQAHDLCLYGLDILAELWSVLYLQPDRTPGLLSAQAEYQARILPALAAQLITETTSCGHPRRPAHGPARSTS